MKYIENISRGQCRQMGEAPSRLVGENPEVSVSSAPIRGASVARVASLVFWTRLFLGVVFIVASADKILDPAAFAQTVRNFQILPDALVNLTALILPWLELLIGLCLTIGCWLGGVTLLANGLLAVFFGSLVFNWARGLDISCGCFGSLSPGKTSIYWLLIRDIAFLLMGAYLFRWHFFRSNTTESLQNQGETSTLAAGKGGRKSQLFAFASTLEYVRSDSLFSGQPHHLRPADTRRHWDGQGTPEYS